MTQGETSRQNGGTESQEQKMLFRWAKIYQGRYPELELLFHIPNGGYREQREAARFKQEGVKAGVPDLFLPIPKNDYAGLFIELKRKKGGRISEAQGWWLEQLRCWGYRAEVCCGCDEAIETIVEYLG